MHKFQKYLHIMIVLLLVSSCTAPFAQSSAGQAPIISQDIATTIAKFQRSIPQQMEMDNIPGLAISVVDDQGILWEESFGYTDWDRRIPVTSSTIFSIQSMSKSFTATAAMFAAQDGLVDLDAPITKYLPNFRVNSIFEENPEQKMTLRILLSHTAGFPHDVAYGGNYDTPPYSFEKHIASISDTWLMCPVGTRYNYSNVGIDLAGYILQVVSGMPFIQYVQEKVLDPLGMTASTLDLNRIRGTATRAIGHVEVPVRPPVDFLIIPSGGVWTSSADMARYLQFHINKGVLDGSRLLREDLAETMVTPPNYPAILAGYALGVTDGTRNGARYIEHGGGGFGFVGDMAWYPELKLGVVVLTNANQTGSYAFNLCLDILDDIIASNIPLYRQRFVSATHSNPAYPVEITGDNLTDIALEEFIKSKALPEDAAVLQRRISFAGTYIISGWGTPVETFVISNSNGELAWYYQSGAIPYFSTSSDLTEVEPGSLFSENGNHFDLRGPVPMVDNIPLVKANPRALPFQIAIYAICGLAFVSALIFWPARLVIWKLRRKSSQANGGTVRPPNSSQLVWSSVLAAFASLISLLCLGVIALVPNMVYFPWPHPWSDLLWWQSVLLSLPFVSLLFALGVALLSLLSTKNSAWTRSIRWYFLAVGIALVVFNLMILI